MQCVGRGLASVRSHTDAQLTVTNRFSSVSSAAGDYRPSVRTPEYTRYRGTRYIRGYQGTATGKPVHSVPGTRVRFTGWFGHGLAFDPHDNDNVP
mgnify:CR=1 FL=1